MSINHLPPKVLCSGVSNTTTPSIGYGNAAELQQQVIALRAELAACREREARMRALLQAADVLFAHHCQDCTAWNWLDNTRTALAEGAQG